VLLIAALGAGVKRRPASSPKHDWAATSRLVAIASSVEIRGGDQDSLPDRYR